MLKRKFVIIFKATQKNDEAPDKFEVTLQNSGFLVKQVKTLDFTYTNLEALKSSLDKPDLYSGIIFSSPRCVNATKLALANSKLHNDWACKANFAVGETTFEQSTKYLGISCLGQDAGNAINLSKIILENKDEYKKPFLYPHGNLKMDLLKDRFVGTNLKLFEVMVYGTIPNPNLREEFIEVTTHFQCIPEYIIFFSPSGVKVATDIIRDVPINNNIIKYIAIGPTTEKAMKECGLSIYGVAEKPTPQDILKLIK